MKKKHHTTAGTIWSIDTPFDSDFAELQYDEFGEENVCAGCNRGRFVKPEGIDAYWDYGSDQIGDFTANVGMLEVAKASIVDELLAHFSGFDAVDVRFPDDPKFHRPKRVTKRTKKRVWLPYEGPPLRAIWVTQHVDLHPSSTVEIDEHCAACGSLVYDEFVGVADSFGEDIEARQQNCGLFISIDELKHCDVFRPRWTGLTLCTDSVKQFVEAKGWKNVMFLDFGEVLL